MEARVDEPILDNASETLEAAVVQPIDTQTAKSEAMTLLASIFLIAACGLVYELLIATVSSYLLGSSVTQFSLSIGIFIGSMGVGSHFSQRIQSSLLGKFITLELVLAMLGGASVAILYWTYSLGSAYWLALYGILFLIGAMVGLELPILTRLLKRYGTFRSIIAQALTFDYLGALVGSILFPLLLLPALGMMRTAFLIGLINVGVAFWNTRAFQTRLKAPRMLYGASLIVGGLLVSGFAGSMAVMSLLETHLYEDEIIYTAQTPYQRIVITRWREDLRLFIDGNLQFSSTDEYRYHEALIHPAMALTPNIENVLLLGAGDGLAARELLKYPNIKQITLVDLDPKMTQLGKTYPAFLEINQNSLNNPKVKIINQDAHKFLETDPHLYDVIISDLPDPNNDVLAKLYSVEFYKLIKKHLSASGTLVVQATSPFFAREAFWCIAKTIEEADLHIAPYHLYVPSFGDWGFVMASHHQIHLEKINLTVETRYLTPEIIRPMFTFGKDASEIPVDVSTFDRPAILEYYLHDWRQWE